MREIKLSSKFEEIEKKYKKLEGRKTKLGRVLFLLDFGPELELQLLPKLFQNMIKLNCPFSEFTISPFDLGI